MPYYLESTLRALPALLWIFLGIGLPYALLALPRKDWQDRPLLLYMALVLGPTLLTIWMFILSTISNLSDAQPGLLRLNLINYGLVVISLVGIVQAWVKWRRAGTVAQPEHKSLDTDEKLIIALIAIATAIRFVGMLYWPFTAYDALWVYGYEGRLYTLLHVIPNRIAYYPQFIPLQYTYAQLAVGGVDDHAARAVLPFLHVASILGVYVLGARLFSRRVGLFAAGIWAFYPHLGAWSRFGDLEVPQAMLFSGAAAFFLMAWLGHEPRRRYAVLSGLLFSVGMWTKPTMGAFALGVALLVAVDLVRVHFDWRAWHPRLEVAIVAGIVSLPLGGFWYLRNVLLGHNAVDFPPPFWPTIAERSGNELRWFLLALGLLLVYLYTRRERPRWPGLVGALLIALGVIPSMLRHFRIHNSEWAILLAGVLLVTYTLRDYLSGRVATEIRSISERLAWALLLALPFFVVWFYFYSYHYRLSFAIVPLMLLPTAVLLAQWFKPEVVSGWNTARRGAYLTLIVLVALPGVVIALHDVNAGWDWSWSGEMSDDLAKYRSGNGALLDVVNGLQIYEDEHNAQAIVVAPGIDRLPFFFPTWDIRVNDAPTRLDDIANATYFVYGVPETQGAYEAVPPLENQVLGGMSRAVLNMDDPNDIIRRAWWKDDGIFNYTVYELHLENRFTEPHPNNRPSGDVVFGGFARLLGHDSGGVTFWPERRSILKLYWEVLAPPPADYMIYIHLRDTREGNRTVWATWDGPVTNTIDGRYYSTLMWQPGEIIIDERVLQLQNPDTPIGKHYQIVIGMYDLQTNERAPVTIDGESAGDGYVLNEPRLEVVAEAPD